WWRAESPSAPAPGMWRRTWPPRAARRCRWCGPSSVARRAQPRSRRPHASRRVSNSAGSRFLTTHHVPSRRTSIGVSSPYLRGCAMSAEDNKSLVRRFYQEIDAGNLDALDELVAEDYLDHSPPPFPGLDAPGREG